MKKQKNSYKLRLFSIVLYVLIISCSDCGLSEKFYREKERERIFNMTDQERGIEKDSCINDYEHMISIVNHEKKRCNFWNCVDGKEELKKRFNSCIWRLENIKK